jgi:hypothetical protein
MYDVYTTLYNRLTSQQKAELPWNFYQDSSPHSHKVFYLSYMCSDFAKDCVVVKGTGIFGVNTVFIPHEVIPAAVACPFPLPQWVINGADRKKYNRERMRFYRMGYNITHAGTGILLVFDEATYAKHQNTSKRRCFHNTTKRINIGNLVNDDM